MKKLLALLAMTITAACHSVSAAETVKILIPGTEPLSVVGIVPYFCKKHGLDVQVTQQANSASSTVVPLLARGEYDLVVASLPAVLISSSNNIDITIATAVLSGGDALFVRNGINSIQDLKGKKVATLKGTGAESYVLDMLTSAGLTFAGGNPDVTIINMPLEAMRASFEAGVIDGFAGIFPDTTDLEDAKKGKVFSEFTQYQRYLSAMKSFYDQPKSETFYKCWGEAVSALKLPITEQKQKVLNEAVAYGKTTQGLHIALPSTRKYAYKISVTANTNAIVDTQKRLIHIEKIKPGYVIPAWLDQSYRNVK